MLFKPGTKIGAYEQAVLDSHSINLKSQGIPELVQGHQAKVFHPILQKVDRRPIKVTSSAQSS